MIKTHDGLLNLVVGMNTPRDKQFYTQYTASTGLTEQECLNLYQSHWLAQQVIDSLLDDATRRWGVLEGVSESDNKQIQTLLDDMCLRAKIKEVLKYSLLFGGGALIVGEVGSPLDQPYALDSLTRGDVLYAQPVSRYALSASTTLETDLTHSQFGLPIGYYLKLPNEQAPLFIHHSHLVLLRGGVSGRSVGAHSEGWGQSVLLPLKEPMMRYESAMMSVSSLFFESNIDVLKMKGLREVLSTEEGTGLLQKHLELSSLMKSIHRFLVIDGEDSYDRKGGVFQGVADVIDRLALDISGATGIPQTKLFGRSPSGLNATGESDIRHYYDKVQAFQEAQLRPVLTAVYQRLCRVVMGKGLSSDMALVFPPLWQDDQKTRAEIAKLHAETELLHVQRASIQAKSQ